MSDPYSPSGGHDQVADGATAVKLAFAWLFVGVPLVWGVWQVVVKTMDLFK